MNVFRAICYEFAGRSCPVRVLKYSLLLKACKSVFGIEELGKDFYVG